MPASEMLKWFEIGRSMFYLDSFLRSFLRMFDTLSSQRAILVGLKFQLLRWVSLTPRSSQNHLCTLWGAGMIYALLAATKMQRSPAI